MKNAVVTLCIGEEFNDVYNVSRPSIESYAKRIEADFVEIKEPVFNSNMKHWEKFQIYDLLKTYHRIIYLDIDLLVRDDCPDLTKIVPEHKIGVFEEGHFTPRLNTLLEAVKLYKIELPKWEGNYYNTGVMVLSRKHRQLFKPPTEMYDMGMGEQSYLNLIILKKNIPVHDLTYAYNRMTCMDDLTGEPRLDSYIIHYAGCPTKAMMIETMRKDLKQWEEDKPDYKYQRHVVISVGGGLGDEIDAEPVVRKVIKAYSNAKITIATWFPRIFEDLLDNPNITVTGDAVPRDDAQYWMHTMPDTRSEAWKTMSHPLVHTIDFASLSCLRTILPSTEKQICLTVYEDDMTEALDVLDFTSAEQCKNLILVHPGKGWESKTFPKSWWDELILKLKENGLQVCIIGMRVSDEQGTVDVDVPDGVIDVRDLLSLGGLFALISMAPVLVSNDSAPVHIAGAFDNWIVLIPTCKHPEHILPWRNGGQQSYKAIPMYRKLTCDAIDNTPTQVYGQTIDYVIGDILDYLPPTEDVSNLVDEIIHRTHKHFTLM